MAKSKTWQGVTFGNGWMHQRLIGMLKYLDPRLLYAFANVFVVPPSMFREGYGHIYRYFRERHGLGRWSAFWHTYRNHCLFAQAVIDKFAMYAGRRFSIEVEGREHFTRLAAKPEGFVILSSHVGNYEIAGYSLVSDQKPINALVFLGEKASVMQNRDKMFEQTHNRMIPVSQDMSHLFAIDSALGRGEIVSIPADRIWGSPKSVTQTFLGRPAEFPLGPFRVALSRGLDVLTIHVMKVSARSYRLYIVPLAYDKEAPKREQTEQLVSGYVAELQRRVCEYPEQWYNYFDFWI